MENETMMTLLAELPKVGANMRRKAAQTAMAGQIRSQVAEAKFDATMADALAILNKYQ
jgi:hypothetical protein